MWRSLISSISETSRPAGCRRTDGGGASAVLYWPPTLPRGWQGSADRRSREVRFWRDADVARCRPVWRSGYRPECSAVNNRKETNDTETTEGGKARQQRAPGAVLINRGQGTNDREATRAGKNLLRIHKESRQAAAVKKP